MKDARPPKDVIAQSLQGSYYIQSKSPRSALRESLQAKKCRRMIPTNHGAKQSWLISSDCMDAEDG